MYFFYSYGHDNVGLAAELADLEEDVVGDEDEAVDTKWTAAPVMKSEPLNKVFIEKQSESYFFVHMLKFSIVLKSLKLIDNDQMLPAIEHKLLMSQTRLCFSLICLY